MSPVMGASARSEDFESLVGPYIEPGYRLALTLLLDPDEARDAVQEAAIKAWRSLSRLRDPATARSWFLSIVANQCRSIRRRHWWSKGRNPLGEMHVDSTDESVVQSLDLARGIRRLAPDDRAILHLRFYMDLPLAEIGRVLGISPGAAKSRLYRAARRLRSELTEEDLK